MSDKGSHFSVPPGAEHAGKEGPHPAPTAVARRLAELQASRELDLGPTSMHVVGTTCTSEPCCALVMCIYASEPWR